MKKEEIFSLRENSYVYVTDLKRTELQYGLAKEMHQMVGNFYLASFIDYQSYSVNLIYKGLSYTFSIADIELNLPPIVNLDEDTYISCHSQFNETINPELFL